MHRRFPWNWPLVVIVGTVLGGGLGSVKSISAQRSDIDSQRTQFIPAVPSLKPPPPGPPESWVIDRHGIGPFRPGMPVAELRPYLDSKSLTRAMTKPECEIYEVGAGASSVGVEVSGGRVRVVWDIGRRRMTTAGVHFGDSVGQLREAYAGRLRTLGAKPDEAMIYQFKPEGSEDDSVALGFFIENGKVREILAGLDPDATEACYDHHFETSEQLVRSVNPRTDIPKQVIRQLDADRPGWQVARMNDTDLARCWHDHPDSAAGTASGDFDADGKPDFALWISRGEVSELLVFLSGGRVERLAVNGGSYGQLIHTVQKGSRIPDISAAGGGRLALSRDGLAITNCEKSEVVKVLGATGWKDHWTSD